VTEDMAEPETTGLLRALGQAEPPGPGVLEAAREMLWSAVAGETFSAGPAGDAGRTDAGRTRAAATDQSRKDTGRHQAEPGS
jgi:hypothetical protein